MEKPPIASKINFAISSLFALIILLLLILNGKDIFGSLKNLNLAWIAGGAGCYLLNYALRTFRLILLTNDDRLNWTGTFSVACIHGFVLYILPLRSGDISLPFMLKSQFGISLKKGGGIFLRLRLLDVITLGIWTIIASVFFHSDVPKEVHLIWASVGFAMILIPAVIIFAGNRSWLPGRQFIAKFINRDSLYRLRSIELLLSLVIWAAIACMLMCVTIAIGLGLSFGDIILLITIQLPLQLSPVQGLGNTGNHEGAWVACLAFLGFTASEALNVALTTHLVLLAYVLLIGAVGFLFGLLSK